MEDKFNDGAAIFTTPMLGRESSDDARTGGNRYDSECSIPDGDTRARGLFYAASPEEGMAPRGPQRVRGTADPSETKVGGTPNHGGLSTDHSTAREEGGAAALVSDGVGLCLLPRAAAHQGTSSCNLVEVAEEDWREAIPVGGVLSARVPSPGRLENATRRTLDHELADSENMDARLCAEGPQLPGANPEQVPEQNVLGGVSSFEEQVGSVDTHCGDYLRNGSFVGDAEQRSFGSVIHQLPVCAVGSERRDASTKGLEPSRDRADCGDADGVAGAGPCGRGADAQSGAAAPVSGLVATDGVGGGSHPCGERFGSITIYLHGVGRRCCTSTSTVEKAPAAAVRSRSNRRGGGAGLLGSVGRLRPELGGMEGARTGAGRRAVGDVGAVPESGEHGSAGSMDSGTAASITPIPPDSATRAVSCSSTGWQRCRVKACQDVRAQRDALRTEVGKVNAQLRHLEKALQLGGEARAWKASLVEAERKLEVEMREHQRSKRDRTTLTNQLRAADVERLELTRERAELKAEVSTLQRRVAEQERVDAKREHEKLVAERYEARQSRKLAGIHEREKEALQQSFELERELAATERLAAQQHLEQAEARAAEAMQAAAAAEAMADEAREDAAMSREQLMLEEEAASAAEKEKNDAQWVAWNAERRAQRAQSKAAKLEARIFKVAPPTLSRTVDEWLQLSAEARRKAAERERAHLLSFFSSHAWRMNDIAEVFGKLGWAPALFDTRTFFDIFFDKVSHLMQRLEKEEYGKTLGLFLHYEMNLTLPKILTVSQAACKAYERSTDRFKAKVLLHHKYLKGKVIHVPRVSPPASVLQPLFKSIERELGVEAGEDGRLAFKSFTVVVQELLAQDPGKHNMPPLPYFLGGAHTLPIVISLDATGFGSQQINTICARNPYMSASAQQLRTFGIGNCSDDREGSKRLLGPNLDIINQYIELKSQVGDDRCQLIEVNGAQVQIAPDVLVVTDVSALRHCERVSNSGWCGCSRDFALRQTPKCKPETVDEMMKLLEECHSHTCEERYRLSHMPLPGDREPQPCTAPGCKYAHDPANAAEELKELLEKEQELQRDTTKAGKAAFSRWRMAHAHSHSNIQPGLYGQPMFKHDLADQILDSLHLAELGLPKTPWKFGVLNNASDDAREMIDAKLKEWKHPLDTRRKEDGRSRAQKWFTGEKWATFCAGERGSPGGPIAIATLMVIVAEDMQLHGSFGKDLGPETPALDSSTIARVPQQAAPAAAAGGRGSVGGRSSNGRGGRGRAAFTDRRAEVADTALAGEIGPPAVPTAKLTFVPSAMEQAADPEDVAIIRRLYGSRAQTILNCLLAFDAYFKWYYPFKASIPFLAPMHQREQHALQCCRAAIDMHEIFERVSLSDHRSFLPHDGAVFKVCRDILRVGDVWAVNISPLELQNAETKRVASTGGSRRLQLATTGQAIVPMRGVSQGPAKLVTTKGYSTTMALSVLNKLLAAQYLRRGDGIIATPESRRKERLFGAHGSGRTKAVGMGIKHEKLLAGNDYEPREDSCIKAFVRLLHAIASASANEPENPTCNAVVQV